MFNATFCKAILHKPDGKEDKLKLIIIGKLSHSTLFIHNVNKIIIMVQIKNLNN